MTILTFRDVYAIGGGVFEVDASDLGLSVGQFPAYFETTLGNGLYLIRTTEDFDIDGDLLFVSYRQLSSEVELRVFND